MDVYLPLGLRGTWGAFVATLMLVTVAYAFAWPRVVTVRRRFLVIGLPVAFVIATLAFVGGLGVFRELEMFGLEAGPGLYTPSAVEFRSGIAKALLAGLGAQLALCAIVSWALRALADRPGAPQGARSRSRGRDGVAVVAAPPAGPRNRVVALALAALVVASLAQWVAFGWTVAPWREGGLYTVDAEAGRFTVVKVLRAEPDGALLRLYGNRFAQRPSPADALTLHNQILDVPGAVSDPVRIVPMRSEALDARNPQFLTESRITDEERSLLRDWDEGGKIPY